MDYRRTVLLLFLLMKYLLIVLLFLLPFPGSAQGHFGMQDVEVIYKTGDLLFQDLDCGGLCDAIEKVTTGVNGKHFSHIGLVFVASKDSTFVIEAIGKDAHLTTLSDFLFRQWNNVGQIKVVHARLKKPYMKLTKGAIDFALKQVHTPYDDAFLPDNGKYYCSELIYDAFKYANNGKPFFDLSPMTYKDPETGVSFPAWVDYFKALGIPIPEGQPGCNPGGLSRSNKIDLITSFY